MRRIIVCVLLFAVLSTALLAAKDIPQWIYEDSLSDGEYHYEWGSAKQGNMQQSIKRAKAAARDNIAEWVKTCVHEIVLSYYNEAGEADYAKQAMDVFENLSIQHANAILTGTEQVEMYFDKNGDFDKPGTVYILMRIPVANIKSELSGIAKDSNVQKSFKKSGSAKEANEMLNAAIDKYFALNNEKDENEL